MTVLNARIISTHLGVPHTDHGILSFSINLDFGESTQAFGGWVLTNNNPGASSLLFSINELFGLDWENLHGTPCRAYRKNGTLVGLGSFLADKWLWIKQTGDDYEFVITTLAEMEEE